MFNEWMVKSSNNYSFYKYYSQQWQQGVEVLSTLKRRWGTRAFELLRFLLIFKLCNIYVLCWETKIKIFTLPCTSHDNLSFICTSFSYFSCDRLLSIHFCGSACVISASTFCALERIEHGLGVLHSAWNLQVIHYFLPLRWATSHTLPWLMVMLN